MVLQQPHLPVHNRWIAQPLIPSIPMTCDSCSASMVGFIQACHKCPGPYKQIIVFRSLMSNPKGSGTKRNSNFRAPRSLKYLKYQINTRRRIE